MDEGGQWMQAPVAASTVRPMAGATVSWTSVGLRA
jgi:hypothetical protein